MGRLEVDVHHSVSVTGRGWWGAEDPSSTKPLPHPIPWVRFTYEDVEGDLTETLMDCQARHMEEGKTDIPYNFMIDAVGKVFEGRGWSTEGERPSSFSAVDGKCLDICYIGDFKDPKKKIPLTQLQTAWYLILHGLKMKYISHTYRVINMHDDTVPSYTASGESLQIEV